MQQIQQQINLFHTLFQVCLGLFLFFLILSVVFFIKFDVRNIFNAKTGRSVKKTVKQLEETNSRTGPLRRGTERGMTAGLSSSKRLSNKVRKVRMEELVELPQAPTDPLLTGTSKQEAETSVLSPEELKPTREQIQSEVDESHGMFRIEKYELLIHTTEVI